MAGSLPIESVALLLDLGLIVIAATFFNFIFRWLKQPSLLAYIVAGIAIGPIGLGAFDATVAQIPLYVVNMNDISLLSELGIAFLLFSVGIETYFSKLKSIGKIAIIGTSLQVGLITSIVMVLTNLTGLLGFNESIYFGMILAFSSTMVVVKLLTDNRTIDTIQGRLMIGFLLVQDAIIILVLPLLANLNTALTTVFFVDFLFSGSVLIVLAYVLSKYVYPHIFKFAIRSQELLYLTAISSAFMFMFVSQYFLGLPLAFGAFLGGLAISPLPYKFQITDEIRGFRDFFVTIFFVTLGMQLSFNFSPDTLSLLLLILGITFAIKPAIFYLITLLSGHGGKIALMVGLGLGQISEFSLILATQGLESGFISSELFSLTIFAMALSMILTPYVFKHEFALYKFGKSLITAFPVLNENAFLHRKISDLEKVAPMKNHTILAGAGTMGTSIAEAIYKKTPLLVLDKNPDTLRMLMKKDIETIYGMVGNQELWEKMNVEKAKMLILAINDIPSSLKIIRKAKKTNSKLAIFARAHHYSDALELYETGADYVIMPQIVGANTMLKAIAGYLETGKKNQLNVLKSEVIDYLKQKSKKQADKNVYHPTIPTAKP